MNKTPVRENSGYERNYDELRIIQGSSGREIQRIYARGVQRLQGRCTFNNKGEPDNGWN